MSAFEFPASFVDFLQVGSVGVSAIAAALVAIIGARAGWAALLELNQLELISPINRDNVDDGGTTGRAGSEAGEPVPFEVEQLTKYYSQILAQSKISFWFSLVFASLGFVAILVAAFFYTDAKQGTTIAQFVAGTIMEAVASLFFVQSRNAQKSMGEFFDKLRNDRLHMESRKLCDAISSSAMKDALKLNLSLHYAGIVSPDTIAKQISDSLLQNIVSATDRQS